MLTAACRAAKIFGSAAGPPAAQLIAGTTAAAALPRRALTSALRPLAATRPPSTGCGRC
jgi:hypothetical protein